MNCVSLICTVHKERGLANVSELSKLLEQLQPEVIFIELPESVVDDYFVNCSTQNLESLAVRQYREDHQVEIVQVDVSKPDESFFSETKEIFRVTEQRSYEYRQLMDTHTANISVHGFAYLNSKANCTHWSNVYREIFNTVSELNISKFRELYDLWTRTNDSRDVKMLENIRDYCRRNSFNRGAFLIGAAHRQSIITKAQDQSATSNLIQWNFDWID